MIKEKGDSSVYHRIQYRSRKFLLFLGHLDFSRYGRSTFGGTSQQEPIHQAGSEPGYAPVVERFIFSSRHHTALIRCTLAKYTLSWTAE